MHPSRPTPIPLPDTFAAALRFLRKRARLTQEELGRSVGYSREQIARLENGSRLPDLAVIAALFVPALLLGRERALVEQFLALAGQTRRDVKVTITHTKETHVQLVEEIEVAARPLFSPPAPLWPLLGRQAEIEALLALLQSARLVTIWSGRPAGWSINGTPSRSRRVRLYRCFTSRFTRPIDSPRAKRRSASLNCRLKPRTT